MQETHDLSDNMYVYILYQMYQTNCHIDRETTHEHTNTETPKDRRNNKTCLFERSSTHSHSYLICLTAMHIAHKKYITEPAPQSNDMQQNKNLHQKWLLQDILLA